MGGAVLALAPGAKAQVQPEVEDWNAKFQATYLWQAKPAMASPYQGVHSLLGQGEKSYSFTATAALGLRLGRATELYFNPEVAQGVPLSGLQGLGGFSNGEMARSSGPRPILYRARLFARQVIGLSDESTEVASATNQLGGRYAQRRLVLSAGYLPVMDLFDANAYAHDARSQFMNWSFLTHAAYDYPADSRGYTWGAAAEYVAGDWTLRAGRFAQPKQPNQLALDGAIGRHYGDQLEFEQHYSLGERRAGTLRLLAFRNRAVMARYDDALAWGRANGQVPDLNAVRRGEQLKSGYGLNLEQQLAADLGLFARLMRADGQTEVYAFTEADRAASVGAVIDGARWGRGDDRVGLAWGQNRLSPAHRAVLAQGGLTFFLGDGRLRYAPEQVLELYYQWPLAAGLALTLDWQRIANPGYNRERGPANFLALRAHAEF